MNQISLGIALNTTMQAATYAVKKARIWKMLCKKYRHKINETVHALKVLHNANKELKQQVVALKRQRDILFDENLELNTHNNALELELAYSTR